MPRLVSRRVALSGLGAFALSCRQSSSSDKASPSKEATPSRDPWGGLTVEVVGDMREEERGGTAVVLLHGWRARGDDLVGLARALAAPRSRFLLPAAPLAEPDGGRAWWRLDKSDRPAPARDDAVSPPEPHPALKSARTAIQRVIATVRERYAPEKLCIAGFSQGAMLALDVALAAPPAVDRVAALSGLLLADSVAGLRSLPAPRPTVFVAHGRQDNVVPFRASELAREMLVRHQFQVVFRPFDGGHTILDSVVDELRRFLFQK